MDVRLVEVTGEHRPLLERWLRAEHVRRYWGEPEINGRLLREPPPGQRRAVIVADGRPVGLVLWQHPSREELDEAGLEDVPESVVDLDIMIGEVDAVGRGIGPEAIRRVAGEALADPAVPYVIAAVESTNPASRRALEKAGFRHDRDFEETACGPGERPEGRAAQEPVRARPTGFGTLPRSLEVGSRRYGLMVRHRPEPWVRRITAKDLPRVAALSGQLGYPVAVEGLARRLAAVVGKSDHDVFVCEVSGTVAGWTHVFEQHLLESEPYAEIGGLVVDAGYRRRGVGRALVGEALRWASARGLGRLRVRSNVAREEAHRFYPSLGFTAIRTQHVYERRLTR